MIPETVLSVLITLAILVAVCWAGHRICRGIVGSRSPFRRLDEPRTHGDEGGHPADVGQAAPCRLDTPAPETGSGLLAGGRHKRSAMPSGRT